MVLDSRLLSDPGLDGVTYSFANPETAFHSRSWRESQKSKGLT